MKRIINTLIILTSLLAASCREVAFQEQQINESIILDLSTGLTKADDNEVERFVNHIDVFFFESSSSVPGALAYYGRYAVNNNSRLTVSRNRSSFEAGKKFFVYLIANSTFSENDFITKVKDFQDLNDFDKQEDPNLHLTGLSIPNAPEFFLMDAVATDTEGSEEIVLNNGVISDNTVIIATLRRAAAKVVINIRALENVEFADFAIEDGSDGGLYYVRNLPYSTFLLAETKEAEDIQADVLNTVKSANEYFDWNPVEDNKNVSLVTYVYPNHWENKSNFEQETCVVMNLPLKFTDSSGSEIDYPNSWYKIQMTDNQTFERNHYYEVDIDLNRPGAIEESTPLDMEEIYYRVKDWDEKAIDVGGDDRPKYLMVNEEKIEMHNVAVDASTLEFASSSPISITVTDVYYYNKFGQKTNVESSVRGQIRGTTDGGIAGNIEVESPVPENNAIRYFTLLIENQDGLDTTVDVVQYPLEYITNQQGWYSYRSDFHTGENNPTTYEYKGSSRYTAVEWDDNKWSYQASDGEEYFFGSKVSEMKTDGTSTLYYYYWNKSGNYVSTTQGDLTALKNARMYHVQITASSSKYNVGIPEQDADGFTDDGEDNAGLVSPSFMIASQLGATKVPQSLEQAKRHCREYVEVYDPDNNPRTDNAIHYDNWRLPTAAEIQIIINFQYVPNAAMDEVLSGNYYWSATGEVENPGSKMDDGQSAVRCIRDVY